jgi:hypothetical protein
MATKHGLDEAIAQPEAEDRTEVFRLLAALAEKSRVAITDVAVAANLDLRELQQIRDLPVSQLLPLSKVLDERVPKLAEKLVEVMNGAHPEQTACPKPQCR